MKFLPKIAASLHAIHQETRSQISEAAGDRSILNDAHGGSVLEDEIPQRRPLFSTLTCNLFRIVQKQLFNEKAVRQLKFFSSIGETHLRDSLDDTLLMESTLVADSEDEMLLPFEEGSSTSLPHSDAQIDLEMRAEEASDVLLEDCSDGIVPDGDILEDGSDILGDL